MEKYDLIIIGGGAGAFAAAIKASELNAKTLLVNEGLPLGGTCVNVGCVPSKTLLFAGEVMHLAKNHNIPGIDIEIKNFDFQKVVSDELDLVTRLREEKYEKVLKNLEYVTHIEAGAKFLSANEIEADGKRYAADKFIIATGSTATIPPIDGIKETGYITHIEALKLQKQPKELIVLGAGALGLEFAQMYARFGTKVAILQRNQSIFPPGEKELTSHLAEILRKEGITIKTNVLLKAVRKQDGKKAVSYEINGKQEEVSASEILVATGKTPNTKELDLPKASVEVDSKQAVVVNENYQTSQSHIFAVGDVVNLPLRQEPSAGREGTLATENALKGTKNKIDYNTVPYTVFTDPQLAGIGLTENEEMKMLGRCLCRTVSFADIPKAIIMRKTEGLIKLVIHPENKLILGVHILAPQAGELISQAIWLIKDNKTIDDVANSLPMFPTLSEAVKLAALSFTKDISKLSCCI
ncbi:mercury(II) reductase [Candidatus Roizmanbacteria bacterium]|nr:mercury(II) reductase [Candidatus Roizmanbacteria bacterium]